MFGGGGRSSGDGGGRHVGVTCDACRAQDFTGIRYKCNECYDFDLCSSCHQSGVSVASHDPSHSTTAMLAPAAASPYGLAAPSFRGSGRGGFGGGRGPPPPKSAASWGAYGAREPVYAPRLSGSGTGLRCPLCPMSTPSESTMAMHIASAHADFGGSAVCPICSSRPGGDPSYRSADLMGHVKMRHLRGLPGGPDGPPGAVAASPGRGSFRDYVRSSGAKSKRPGKYPTAAAAAPGASSSSSAAARRSGRGAAGAGAGGGALVGGGKAHPEDRVAAALAGWHTRERRSRARRQQHPDVVRETALRAVYAQELLMSAALDAGDLALPGTIGGALFLADEEEDTSGSDSDSGGIAGADLAASSSSVVIVDDHAEDPVAAAAAAAAKAQAAADAAAAAAAASGPVVQWADLVGEELTPDILEHLAQQRYHALARMRRETRARTAAATARAAAAEAGREGGAAAPTASSAAAAAAAAAAASASSSAGLVARDLVDAELGS